MTSGGERSAAADASGAARPYPPIADYGLIGDAHSCALVSKAGSVDWACFPRFDSPSTFGRLLDWERGGYFQLAPADVRDVSRRYLPGTNVLETTFETATGRATLTDFMPVRAPSRADDPRDVHATQEIARVLECVEGTVEVQLQCQPRFDYGSIVPHADLEDDHTGFAHGGADAIALYSTAPLRQVDGGYEASARLAAGERLCASLRYQSRLVHGAEEASADEIVRQLDDTVAFWRAWCGTCTYEGEYQDEVLRSALALKALTYAPSGALLAAATTSLPEHVGGQRNWDYRFTWIRDAAFAVYALSLIGLHREVAYFKDWLEWSSTGRANDLQIMYGLAGERRLTEYEVPGLEGYRGSRPVRIGNAACDQFQLDIYGELLDSAHLYRKFGGEVDPRYWEFLQEVVAFVLDHWRDPDNGIWETRGERQHFVFSKVMCWVALDRAIKAARALDLPGDVERWREVRAEIRADVLERGYDADRGAFVQAYGSKAVDASVLMLPLVRFIRADDPRMRSTLAVIERELTSPEGFVYRHRGFDDGLPDEEEGTFNICTFWFADNLIMLGELDRARALFERLCASGNDLGLLSEETRPRRDGGQGGPAHGGMLGNFPQAFSHLGLINTAVQLQQAALRALPRAPNAGRPVRPRPRGRRRRS